MHVFDYMERSELVGEGVNLKLEPEQKNPERRFLLLKIAAVIVLVLAIPAVIYIQTGTTESRAKNDAPVDPEIQELMEAEAYYAEEVSGKLAEIQKCYKVHPELKSEIETDLNELESMYILLKKDLHENISNKEVIEAMIENNRNRMKLVDEVLEQINC